MPINFKKLGKYKKPGVFGFPECKMCGPVYDEVKEYSSPNMNGVNYYNGEFYCNEHLLIVQRQDKLKRLNEI